MPSSKRSTSKYRTMCIVSAKADCTLKPNPHRPASSASAVNFNLGAA